MKICGFSIFTKNLINGRIHLTVMIRTVRSGNKVTVYAEGSRPPEQKARETRQLGCPIMEEILWISERSLRLQLLLLL